MNELIKTEEIEIKRSIYGNVSNAVKECHIHGFSDASQKVYCCVINAHIATETENKAEILTAKTGVASLKDMTIPRGELTAARILAQLLDTVREGLKM